MRIIYIFYIFVTITYSVCAIAAPLDQEKKILKIDLMKEVGSTTWIYIKEGFYVADTTRVDAILIHMNTYGGELLYADSIRTKILNSKIPVYVFIDNNAASAGALIALACDKIFMRPGGSIGAATVVNENAERLPDKYQSYMRAMMRATAESQGKDTLVNGTDTTFKWRRDPIIAEAMVDNKTVIPGLLEAGKTLTFTTMEALKYGYCDGIASSSEELVEQQLQIKNYQLINFEPDLWDNVKGFLMSGVVQSILIMLIVWGIYFELQAPGIGLPLGLAISAAVLYFAPLYIDGLAANWEILLFLIGLLLLGLELFVIPGFGIAGISGITLVMAGLILSMLNNDVFNFKNVDRYDIGLAILITTVGMGLAFGLIIYISSKIGTAGIFKKIALNKTLETSQGYIAVSMDAVQLIGKTGVASTVLRPSGKVRIDGVTYDAISSQTFIEKGASVKVVRYETGQLYVEPLDN